MPLVDVVIPNLNGKNLLPICLDSLGRQTLKDFVITVVDNHSTDGTLEFLTEKYPYVRVIRLEKNYGFAYAVNRGIEASTGEYVALLNNDVEVDPKWLEELCRALDEHPDVGSCNSKMLMYRERGRINGLGISMTVEGDIDILGWKEADRGQYEEERFIFAVGAGASLYRRKMFQDIGLFDETFFANFEDVDVSFRAQLAGYKALYVPKAIAYHMVGATIKKMKYLPTYLNNRNKVLFYWKSMPDEIIRKYFSRILWKRSGFIFKRILVNFYKLRTYYFLKGIFAAYRRLPYILKERKRIQAMRRVSIDYLESILDKDFI